MESLWQQFQGFEAWLLPEMGQPIRNIIFLASAVILFLSLGKGIVKFLLALVVIVLGIAVLAYISGFPFEEFVESLMKRG